MTDTILEIKGLSKNFGPIKAVSNLDLTIKKGSIFGLLGPNGSGKSTTLGMILGVVKKTSGEFYWYGQEPTAATRRKIGAILESPTFFPYLSGVQNLRIICQIKEVPVSRIPDVLQQVGLWDRKDSPFKTYSLGMKQRLAIASALLADPGVLILDEPTNGLDPQGIAEIRELIVQIAESGKTIILASHLLDEVQKVCTEFVVLRTGEKIFQGSVAESISGNEGIELAADDMESLEKLVNTLPEVLSVKYNNVNRLEVRFSNEVNMTQFHQSLIDKKVVLTHLSYINRSLEKQFLQILSDQNA
jgi:ABC-type multidrug transport system ATPase subunit